MKTPIFTLFATNISFSGKSQNGRHFAASTSIISYLKLNYISMVSVLCMLPKSRTVNVNVTKKRECKCVLEYIIINEVIAIISMT